jgi:hypothetical protein
MQIKEEIMIHLDQKSSLDSIIKELICSEMISTLKTYSECSSKVSMEHVGQHVDLQEDKLI